MLRSAVSRSVFSFPAVVAAAALAVLVATPLPAAARDTPRAACAKADERQVAAWFDGWNAALATRDPAKVAARYAPDAVLLATVSNQPRTTPAEIRDYFAKFLPGGPQGRIDSRTVHIGCNTVTDVGTYTFSFDDGRRVAARYTYVYEWHQGQWLIAHHHSSAMPEQVAAR